MECYKCNGTGKIPGFSHVSGGVCFQCNGAGVLPDAKNNNVGYSRSIVASFYHSASFQEKLAHKIPNMQVLKRGMEAWDNWIFLDTNTETYYICAPICRRNDWYEIPVMSLPEFLKHNKKAFKHSTLSKFDFT